MKPFSAAIAADVDGAFLSPAEFGDPHTLEGVQLIAVVETYRGHDAEPGAAQRSDLEMHCRTDALDGMRIRARSTVTLDGKNYIVAARHDDLGITTLELARGQG